MAGVSEISLFTTEDVAIARASIVDLSEGGVLVTHLPPHELATITTGRKLKFQFVVPTGEVQGLAEVVRVEPSKTEMALRLLSIENQAGLPNLLGFLHSWFCGVD
jgi:hypothetical protein